MVLSAKVRRNERLWHTQDIGICLGQCLASKFHNNLCVKNRYCNPAYFYLTTWEKIAPPYTSPNLAKKTP